MIAFVKKPENIFAKITFVRREPQLGPEEDRIFTVNIHLMCKCGQYMDNGVLKAPVNISYIQCHGTKVSRLPGDRLPQIVMAK